MPTSGTSPLSRAEQVEGQAVEAGHAGAVGVARPPAAALGEEHDRQPLALGQLEQPVLLAVVLQALRAGQHGVVVRHHHGRRGRRRCRRRRPARRPGVRSMSSSTGRRRRWAAMTSGAVLDEAAGVDEVVDVLPGACAARWRAGGPRRRAGPRRARRRHIRAVAEAICDACEMLPAEQRRRMRKSRARIRREDIYGWRDAFCGYREGIDRTLLTGVGRSV